MDDATTRATPVIPLPNPGEGGPVYDGSSEATPVIPLPNPGEGGPVYPGSQNVTIQLVPDTAAQATIRFFNAAGSYPDMSFYLDGIRAFGPLPAGNASGYLRIYSGRRRVSVRGSNGYVYVEQLMDFPALSSSTVALITRTGGLELVRITDACRIVSW